MRRSGRSPMQYVEAKCGVRRVRLRRAGSAHDRVAAHIEENNGRCFLWLRKRMRDVPRYESMEIDERAEDPQWNATLSPDEGEDLRDQRQQDRRARSRTVLAESVSAWEGPGPFERLGKYERQLELGADLALRELRQLRKDRGEGWKRLNWKRSRSSPPRRHRPITSTPPACRLQPGYPRTMKRVKRTHFMPDEHSA